MQEAGELSVRSSSDINVSAAAATLPTWAGGGWLIGLAECVRPGVGFRRITTWDSGGVDRTDWLPAGGATSFSKFPSTAILRFMYFSKMASRRTLSSAFRRSSSSCLLLQQANFTLCTLQCPQFTITVQKNKHQIAFKVQHIKVKSITKNIQQ